MAKTSKSEKAVKPNVFMRIGLFIKQIIDELRKVVTPTAKELFFWSLSSRIRFTRSRSCSAILRLPSVNSLKYFPAPRIPPART